MSRCMWTRHWMWPTTATRRGLYTKARRGELRNFTGIDSPYEMPEAPELRVNTAASTPEKATEQVIAKMRALGLIA